MTSRSDDERTIMSMFSYMRPHGSKAEDAFVARFLTPLGFKRDAYKNLVLKIGSSPSILWSSHMDTVHSVSGTQTLHYDGTTLALSRKSKAGASSCLGADDTAGVWLMTEMVKAGVEGLYVIHHGEESGCIGSSDLAKDAKFFTGIKAAIAFDRMGYDSIITHQSGGRTASDAFALSLGSILGGAFRADEWGAYTDTNEYAHIVPECTNISVGYFRQHTRNETQDIPFLIALRDVLVTADFSSLVIARDPAEDPYADDYLYARKGNRRGTWRDAYAYSGSFDTGHHRSSVSSSKSMDDLCKQYPEIAADLLEEMGISRNDFMDRVASYYGNVFGTEEDDDEPPFDDREWDDGLPESNTVSEFYRTRKEAA